MELIIKIRPETKNLEALNYYNMNSIRNVEPLLHHSHQSIYTSHCNPNYNNSKRRKHNPHYL
jgi:hypothetical protein